MYLRRMLVAAAPALLVAELAHAAGFGSDHLLGGEAGQVFLRAGLAWAALLTILGMLDVALRAPLRGSSRLAVAGLTEALPGRGNVAVLAAALAAGGGVFYAALEALEGHAPLGSLLVLAVIVPLAAAVAAGIRLALAWIAGAGVSIAALTRSLAQALAPSIRLAPVPLLAVRTPAEYGLRRGRAPPPRARFPQGI